MRKVIDWILWIIATALMVKVALWAYQSYSADGQQVQQGEVPDYKTRCSIVADTGQCTCHHVETGHRVSIKYDECVSRARKNPNP